eukprot:COSAG06_NODE_4628_length_4087_cov_9.310682_2_plen_80_part_00
MLLDSGRYMILFFILTPPSSKMGSILVSMPYAELRSLKIDLGVRAIVRKVDIELLNPRLARCAGDLGQSDEAGRQTWTC